MLKFLTPVLFTIALCRGQISTFPGSSSGGSGAPNLFVAGAGPATSASINITSLNLTSATLNTLVWACSTGTGFSGGSVTGPLTPMVTATTTMTATTSTASFAFTSSSNYLCVVSSNGGAGPAGPTGAAGATGSTGAAGNTILNGTSTPSIGTGNNGDFFLYTTTSCLYGPKAAGAWPGTCTSLIGPTGATGATGTNGTNGAGYSPATSTTSLTIGTGSQSLTTQSGLAYQVGARARITYATTTTDYMEGLVTSYSGTSLVVNVDTVGGSGTFASWLINIAGNPGTAGATGGTGPAGSPGLLSGTLAAIPATCTVGTALYQATDQPAGLQIYVCTATNTWTRTPYLQGTTNPATCSVGQVFFNTASTAGSNLQLCTSTNTWTQVTGGGGVTTFSPGTGLTGSVSGSVLSAAVDTSLIPTKAVVQLGTSNAVTVTSSGTATLTGTGNPTMTAYADKQPINLTANYTSIGTINVDGEGAKNAYLGDGVTTPVPTISGQQYSFLYNASLNSSAGGWQCVSANCSSGGAVAGEGWYPAATAISAANTNGIQLWDNGHAVVTDFSFASIAPGLLLYTSGGANITYFRVQLPAPWDGTFTLKLMHTIDKDNGGTGTVSWTAQIACVALGTTRMDTSPTYIGSPITFASETFLSGTGTGSASTGFYGSNEVVSPTSTGCAAGNLVLVKLTYVPGTTTDNAIVYGAYVTLH